MCDIESNAGHTPDTLSGAMADMHDQVADARRTYACAAGCVATAPFSSGRRWRPQMNRRCWRRLQSSPCATEGKHFSLPCHHHQNRVCTIYESWRPHVCHAFRCRLLRRYDAREISLAEASAVVDRARQPWPNEFGLSCGNVWRASNNRWVHCSGHGRAVRPRRAPPGDASRPPFCSTAQACRSGSIATSGSSPTKRWPSQNGPHKVKRNDHI